MRGVMNARTRQQPKNRRQHERGLGLAEFAIVVAMVVLTLAAGLYLLEPPPDDLEAALRSVTPDPTPTGTLTPTPSGWEPSPTSAVRNTPAPPQAYHRDRQWPFFDDFNAGVVRWHEVAGRRWRMADGRYCAGPGGEHRSTVGDAGWTDYAIHVSANLLQGTGYGIYFRATDWPLANAYLFQYDPGYEGGSFLFYKIAGGQKQDPLADSAAAEGFEWYEKEHQIRLEVKGDAFTAYVDGKQVLQASDDAYDQGGVGLYTWGSAEACFDDVRVEPAGE